MATNWPATLTGQTRRRPSHLGSNPQHGRRVILAGHCNLGSTPGPRCHDLGDQMARPILAVMIPADVRDDDLTQARMGHVRQEGGRRHVRQMPPQLNLNLNLGLQLPPGLSPEQLPGEVQNVIQEMLQKLQGQIASVVQAELMKQAPIQRTEGSLFNASWQDATSEGI